MELVTARSQQQFAALWAIAEKTAPRSLPRKRGKMLRAELIDLTEALYERLEAIHAYAQEGLAKPAAETAHEALSHAAITGEGMSEAMALFLNSPLPMPIAEQ